MTGSPRLTSTGASLLEPPPQHDALEYASRHASPVGASVTGDVSGDRVAGGGSVA